MMKKCLKCKQDFEKRKTKSIKDFLYRTKFCSLRCKHAFFVECIPWNKGQRGLNIGWPKGSKFTEAHRASLSMAHKGKKPWNKGIFTNVIPWNKGKKLSLEIRQKLSDAHKGILHSQESRKKMSEAMKGDKHWAWKGGVSPLQNKIRSLFQMKEWSRAIMKRDFFICQWCKAKSGVGKAIYLVADHIKMFSRILEIFSIKTIEQAEQCKELWDINNGQTLCKSCHLWKTKIDNKIWKGTIPKLNIIYNLT